MQKGSTNRKLHWVQSVYSLLLSWLWDADEAETFIQISPLTRIQTLPLNWNYSTLIITPGVSKLFRPGAT